MNKFEITKQILVFKIFFKIFIMLLMVIVCFPNVLAFADSNNQQKFELKFKEKKKKEIIIINRITEGRGIKYTNLETREEFKVHCNNIKSIKELGKAKTGVVTSIAAVGGFILAGPLGSAAVAGVTYFFVRKKNVRNIMCYNER